ncbi:hypothetical protein BDU57DRAFT_594144 [Ampelomyces quisqualis]|uniref:leucine--tRNA ligase n=1 Tax=Ampelomyces quisqualis TaxID=50730 RepID=A0A6A5QTK1_AMPQU|nr:hypothetical protein BDU57DRAFT_594144 [Ampelomyces quisqualis]
MVRFSLQRVCRRGALGRRVHPCLGRASLWTASAAERQQRAADARIETLTAKWQPHWDNLDPQWNALRKSDKGKAYVLPMFPYPSGTLHLGHLRVYTISDVLARFKHMQGYQVLHPIGWDAFGLPAENAAIERRVHPEKWTLQNIAAMKSQMKVMGGRWDWDSEIRTCDPNFYKHTQRLFLMLHKHGLAYQAESRVNYDPIDETVLANEQVDSNGRSWRSGAKVEKIMLKQWFLKIKEYQEPLLKDLAALAKDGKWPEKVLAMQRNWIGKSEGAQIRFHAKSTTSGQQLDPLEVFTTRADTLFGVQYIALSLGHPIVQQEALQNVSLREFIEHAKGLPHDTKEGFLISSVTAHNPLAELVPGVEPVLPVYVAPYVLDDYGSGAVMGVPGHDARDHAFWRANIGGDPIRVVVTERSGTTPAPLVPGSSEDAPLTEKGYVTADIDGFSGLRSEDAARKVVATLQSSGKHAKMTENWRLRDWLISRQRYWGTPIPIIHCKSCGPVPVPENELPVELPNFPDSFFNGKKGNPLAQDESWKKTECPKCGSAAERETDTMDTFMDSSWYFFRFLDPNNEAAMVNPESANEGMPVDLYIGGVEHAILHLLYARFISKFLASTSTWPQGKSVHGEPFKQLITQGMVHGETFTNPENGRFLRPDELDLATPSMPRIKATGLIPTVSYEKMSKSKYNGVDPAATIASYGADATRAHMLFQAPIGDVLEWDPRKIKGVQRWLLRVVRLSTASWMLEDDLTPFEVPVSPDATLLDILIDLAHKDVLKPLQVPKELPPENLLEPLTQQDNELWIKTQQTIASVNESYSQTYSLNTIVSDLMTLTNTIHDTPHSSVVTPYLKWYSLAHLVRMVAPIAPGVAEEAWHLLTAMPSSEAAENSSQSRPATVFATGFPKADLDIIPRLTRTMKCVVQVDGKRKFEAKIGKMTDTCTLSDKVKMARWVLDQVVQTPESKEWLGPESGKVWNLSDTGRPHPLYEFVPEDWQVITANKGRLCNIVSPKKGKGRGRGSDLIKEPAEGGTTSSPAIDDPASSELSVQPGIKTNLAGTWPEFFLGELQQTQQASSARISSQSCDLQTDLRLPSCPAIDATDLQKVHARVNLLMRVLPRYLRPRYVPSHLFPVQRAAIIRALKSPAPARPWLPNDEDIAIYETEISNHSTSPSIAQEYIIDSIPTDLTGSAIRQLITTENAIFSEQLTLLYDQSLKSPLTMTLLPVQWYSIKRKLRAYRKWNNSHVDDTGKGPKMPTVSDEKFLSVFGMSREGVKLDRRKKPEYLDESWVRFRVQRFAHVWQQIISLWAGQKISAPRVRKDRVTGNDAVHVHGDRDLGSRAWPAGKNSRPKNQVENGVGDWLGLAGKDPNPKGRAVRKKLKWK